ncbi:DUF58 domain-containing protein [Ekhidna sp.]|jgi:uncharacterized protein (DUF58 family)|uniref:DUF58 domain-containing protein n=1 Tax=Ekhidna sp. TaxID=2608089 RepID=UPI0032EEE82B
MTTNISEINQYDNLGLIAKQLVDGFITGLHKSPYHGFSVEFAEHKLYNYGESTRHIDWKVFSRTDRLYTKQYEEETNLRCRILIDNSASMHYPMPGKDKLKFSVFAASALSYLLTKQRDVVGLSVFSDRIEEETELRSTKAHLNSILTKLSELQETTPAKKTDISSVLHEMADKIHKRSLVVIFSDMFQNTDEDDLLSALQHLKHNKHEVILFHVSDYASELNFEFEDRPYKFIDIETNESVKVNPHDVKDVYRKEMAKFYQDLKIKCGMMKVDFVPVNTNDSFDKILGAYLIKRKKMR